MTDLERIKKDVVEMDSRANVCWYDTKVLTKAVRLILEELTADRKTEPITQTKTQNSNLTFEKDECAKEYEELGLKELKELIEADRKTENSSEIPNNCKPQTDMAEDIVRSYGFKAESYQQAKAKDEPQTQLTAKCLNCNNSKVCKEKHWDGCAYEPKDEKTCETCRHWKYIAHEWQCEACKCQGYEPKDEPQTETSTNSEKVQLKVQLTDEPQTDCAWK